MLKALNSPFLLNYFGEIRRWTVGEMNRSRKVWIEMFGIPFHAWCEENAHKIAAVWGTVLKVEESSMERHNLDSIKALVDTSWGLPINDRVMLVVDGDKFKIFIKETWGVEKITIWETENRLDAEMEKQNNEELYGSKMEEKIESQVIGVEEEDDDMAKDGEKIKNIYVKGSELNDDQILLHKDMEAHEDRGVCLDLQQLEVLMPLKNSRSIRYIFDDRISLEVIQETQWGLKGGPSHDEQTKEYGLKGEESFSGPTLPPSFEESIKKRELNMGAPEEETRCELAQAKESNHKGKKRKPREATLEKKGRRKKAPNVTMGKGVSLVIAKNR
ncbi:uncharacterized protein LOC110264411 [Arachis ipaensis]|uniref:uncharacterized protein LOC110264411 n=1 Tax=Arachis ipaensis TaxID=130454 RepID=UPI000A2AF504|nr:uncharacterized protein LOC110264411 [Arachis ipaensis]QHN94180.1 uncharacterized protein DS421_17g599040 [Arachis hypogaea]